MSKQGVFGAIAVVLGLLAACQPGKKKTSPKPVIIQQLEAIKGKGILFGHQDDLAYGMGWSYQPGESDVKRVAGDYPALFGWELGGIELDHTHNLDSVPFEAMRQLAVWGHGQGGINTFSWHPFSPIDSISSWNGDSVVVKHLLAGGSHHEAFKMQLDKLAAFLVSMKDAQGTTIPFIFRPWHEMDGSWFWWGTKACTPDEFKALFKLTVDHLRSVSGLEQMAVAYSPDCNFETPQEYLTWYPGDAYVDILGMDDYWDFKQPNGVEAVIAKLHLVIHTAIEKGKPAALTETGYENVTDTTFYSQKLGVVLNDSLIANELSYAMVWRNDPKVHFFFPYPGHPAEADAKAFCQQDGILLLEAFKQLK